MFDPGRGYAASRKSPEHHAQQSWGNTTYFDEALNYRPPSVDLETGDMNWELEANAFQYAQCIERRKALVIGIGYYGQPGQLMRPVREAKNMRAYLIELFGYKPEDIVMLTDDQQRPTSQPTKQNLLRAMHWLVKDARLNDSLFFYYSGHGDPTEALDGNEEGGSKEGGSKEGGSKEGGYHNTIFPVDFRQVGHITDEEMHRIMVAPLQAGVRLTAIFDSHHVQSILDFPYFYSFRGILKEPNAVKEAGQGVLAVISRDSEGTLDDTLPSIRSLFKQPASREQAHARTLATETSPTDVVMLSGSEDDQNSYRQLLAEMRLDEIAPRSYQIEPTTSVPGAPTDSGYASAPYTKNLSQVSPDQAPIQTIQDPKNHDNEDSATVYSDTSSMALSRRETYVLELADDLFDKVSLWNLDSSAKERISAVLPDLLRDFALKIGYNAETQMHRNVMAYVHKHRQKIAETFTEMCLEQAGNSPESAAFDSEDMSLEDRMNLWFDKEGSEETRRAEGELNDVDFGDIDPRDARSEDSDSAPDIGSPTPVSAEEVTEHGNRKTPAPMLLGYRDFVFHTEAYEWLLAGLQREFRLTSTEPNTIQTIRQSITSFLPLTHRVSRKTSLESYRVRFDLDWNPLAFLVQQQYAVKPAEAVLGAITVTGTCQDAQAATCLEYMKQTWPLTGELTLKLIKQALGGEPGNQHLCRLSDGTELGVWIDKSKLFAEVSGVAASITEIGEQLAWLGAALRSSTREEGLVYCTPVIMRISTDDTTPQIENMSLPPQLVFEIGFTIEEVVDPLQRPNGQCWHDVFRNPVVVKGYPIPRRKNANTGLEVHLNVLAGLARTQRVDHFKERFFLKGFSTMLVPTMRDGDILCWHLVYNKDGSRISYLDNNVVNETWIIHSGLENLRHVLGWCSEAQFYGGSAQATYHVDHAGLPRAHGDCALSNIRVSAGKLIAGGLPFHLGLKDTPTHMTRSGYIPRLKWVSTKLVLLWDEADKRGWLINGTSALLHIVRASLAHDSRDKFKSAFVFKSEYLQESSTPFTADSATDVLINPNNMSLKLYPEKDGYLTLESRIDHYYNILEKLIDHQADIAGYCGIDMANQPRRNLEGWDFTDLVTNHDPLHPRVATIEPKGKGWVDFTRAVHAVTLVGRGFGNIIQPVGTNTCEYWSELPKQRYYLATCISDLGHMISENDYHNDMHVRLSENIIWHTPTTIFGSRRCKGLLELDHCEPVQTLIPSALSGVLLPRTSFIPQGSRGAVIFGYNSTFRWVWGDRGHPNEGELVPSSNASDVDSFYDSGIGTSQKSAGLERTINVSRASTRTLIRSSSNVQSDAVFPEAQASVNKKSRNRREYTVGILCALPKELMAIRALFDKRHDNVDIPRDDSNHYALGEICHHMVVAACLPAGEIGTNSAAHSISNMSRSFPSLRLGFCLLVGIGGGAPSEENDIRLGDVVVSHPTRTYPGVLQYDRGKEKENTCFELTGSLAPPSRYLMSAISSLRSDPDLPPDPLRPYLMEIASRFPDYHYPGQGRDQLFKTSCAKCQALELCSTRENHIIHRNPRPTDQPRIHYGLIASGNRVLKDSKVRDSLAREHGVLCFEMEAAGVVNAGLDCLVIRGISDYADAAKNKEWQRYAAASAAAYAKLLLGVMTSKHVIDSGNVVSVTPARRRGSELDIGEDNEGPPWKRRR
ncbi:hypothetical protein F4782DRAFT_545546 [Xylaria castorea]|nr:hypothetical protein F4782DRAFT_545546 [Xylaria castorea]